MSRRSWFAIAAVLVLSLAGTSLALAASQGPKHHGPKDHGPIFRGGSKQFFAVLNGHNETPAIHTNGTGKLTLTVNNDGTQLSFELTYANLSSPAQMAHVHFGAAERGRRRLVLLLRRRRQARVPGRQHLDACDGHRHRCSRRRPGRSPAQGLPAGDLNAILSEIKAGFAYANVHTTNFGGGEIRGQLVGGHGHFGPGWDDRKH